MCIRKINIYQFILIVIIIIIKINVIIVSFVSLPIVYTSNDTKHNLIYFSILFHTQLRLHSNYELMRLHTNIISGGPSSSWIINKNNLIRHGDISLIISGHILITGIAYKMDNARWYIFGILVSANNRYMVLSVIRLRTLIIKMCVYRYK